MWEQRRWQSGWWLFGGLAEQYRKKYWEITGETPNEENKWICSYCGQDTSCVEYDYLAGTDHIECVLKTNV